jgi:hypothetical protein
MSHNPIYILDQQLREAVRRRRRGWLRHKGVIAVAAALVLGGGVAAASQLISKAEHSAADRAIAAGQTAALKLPACAQHRPNSAPRMVDGPLPADVTQRLGIFRRGRTSQDRIAARNLRFGGTHVLSRSIRIARAADGARFAMYVSYGAPNLPGGNIDVAACDRATLTAALAQPQAKDATVRAQIHSKLEAQIRRAQDLIDGAAHFLTINQIDATGQLISGGATVLHDGKIPAFASTSHGRRGGQHTVIAAGLVPDEVHDVRIISSSRAGHPHVVPIRDNMYHARLTRTGPRLRVQWRTRQGRVIRTTHLEP